MALLKLEFVSRVSAAAAYSPSLSLESDDEDDDDDDDADDEDEAGGDEDGESFFEEDESDESLCCLPCCDCRLNEPVALAATTGVMERESLVLKACSTTLYSVEGSMRQKEPLPGSFCWRATLTKLRLSDKLWRIEFCQPFSSSL